MSIYFVKAKGWRYDFMLNGVRYTQAGFKTKTKAKLAEAEKRKEVLEPPSQSQTPTDMGFLELVNGHLDHVRAYHSPQHYAEYKSRAKRWIRLWKDKKVSEISKKDVKQFVLRRRRVSAHTANKELVRLRATFNFGINEGWITVNPTKGISKFPEGKKQMYIPTAQVVEEVISFADPDTQDYLWTIRDTMGRMSEINHLTWDDVSLLERYVTLYTRKKRGGDLTSRRIPMTDRVHGILSRRFARRDRSKPWVFWHIYWSSKTGERCEGPYKERKRIMRTLCQKAGVPYFRFHPLRHSGAHTLDQYQVPIRDIQKLLGHESRVTTEIYLKNLAPTEREAIAVLDFTHQFTHNEQLSSESENVIH